MLGLATTSRFILWREGMLCAFVNKQVSRWKNDEWTHQENRETEVSVLAFFLLS